MRILFLQGLTPVENVKNYSYQKKEIKLQLRKSRYRGQFEFYEEEVLHAEDISQSLLDFEPNIIHLSADLNYNEIEDEQKKSFISSIALHQLFDHFRSSIKCLIVSNYSNKNEIEAYCNYVPYTIGIPSGLAEKSIHYIIGFYQALFAKRSFISAHNLGLISIKFFNENVPNLPILVLDNESAKNLKTEVFSNNLRKVKPVPDRWIDISIQTENLKKVAISPANQKEIFVSVNKVRNSNIPRFYHSKDGGSKWQELRLEPLKNLEIKHIEINDLGIVYLATEKGLFTYNSVSRKLELDYLDKNEREIRCVVLHPVLKTPFIRGLGKYWSGAGGGGITGATLSGGSHFVESLSTRLSSGDYHISIDESFYSLPIKNVNTISISPLDPNLIFLGTSDDGVFRSENGGLSFEKVKSFEKKEVVCIHIATSPWNIENIYLGTRYKGLWKSFDGGISWEVVTAVKCSQVPKVLFSHKKEGHIFIATNNGIFQSKDYGLSWNEANRGLHQKWVMDIDQTPSGNLIAGTSTGGVYIKPTNRLRWEPSNNGFLGNNSIGSIKVINQNQLLIGGSGVYLSVNGGISWNGIGYFQQKSFHPDLVMALETISTSYKSTLNDEDIHLSLDYGSNWINPGGFEIGLIFAGTQNGKVYKTTDLGNTWIDLGFISEGHTINSIHFEKREEILYAGSQGGGIYRSRDFGNSWELIKVHEEPKNILSIHESDDGKLFFTSANGLFTSEDKGEIWHKIELSIGKTPIYCLSTSKSKKFPMYLATDGKGAVRYNSESCLWEEINDKLPTKSLYEILVHPLKNNIIFIGTKEYGIFRSTDFGETWSEYNDGILFFRNKNLDNNGTINRLAISASSPPILFGGTVIDGLYKLVLET